MQLVSLTNLHHISAGTSANISEDSLFLQSDVMDQPPNYLIAIGAFCLIYGLLEKYSPDLK